MALLKEVCQWRFPKPMPLPIVFPCLVVPSQDVSSQLLPGHAGLPAAILPTTMIMHTPSETASPKQFLLQVALVVVSYYSNRRVINTSAE